SPGPRRRSRAARSSPISRPRCGRGWPRTASSPFTTPESRTQGEPAAMIDALVLVNLGLGLYPWGLGMGLDFSLSEEQALTQKTVRDLFSRYAPRAREIREMVFKQKKFPQEIWDDLASAGFLGSVIPEEFGGTGMGLLPLTLAMEKMGSLGFGN